MDAHSHEDRPTPVFLGSPPTDRATLACQPCRRRKAKCDRLLPSCNVCARTLQTCIYPAKRLKPGPKIGSTQRGRKRVRFNSHGSIPSQDLPASTTREYIASSQEPNARAPRNSVSAYPTIRETSGSTQSSFQTMPLNNSRSPDSFSPPTNSGTDEEPGEGGKEGAQIAAAFLETMNLANIMHPTHEKAAMDADRSPPLWSNHQAPVPDVARQLVLQTCDELGFHIDQLRVLARTYFANMTAFTLFHQPTIRQKIYAIRDPLHNKALIAAICSFAARFVAGYPDAPRTPGTTPKEIPPIQDHERIHKLATKWVLEALNECEDETPPLCLLQALVLTTFYKLTEGVRGRAWRLLGTCVRIAYEQRLNFIDIDRPDYSSDVEKWCVDEERRRCWWAIWEMDVFASSIRRCPAAIDWTTNETYLPAKDSHWFNGRYQKSCVLELNAADRVNSLRECGNRGADAWFIVLNSIMRDAQLVSNISTILPDIDPDNNVAQMIQYFQNQFKGKKLEDAERKLPGLENALRSFTVALPTELAYNGEYLGFMKGEVLSSATILARRQDVAKHSIHLTFQYTKIMINHHYAFREIVAGKKTTENSRYTGLNWNMVEPEVPTNAQGLQNCMDSADDILAILTRCSEQYVQYVNPFLASTIWLATALQVLRKVFSGNSNPDLIASKCEVLRSHCEQYSQVWGTPMALIENLDSLEERLREKQRQRYDIGTTSAHFVPRGSSEEKAQFSSSNEQNQGPVPEMDWMTWQQRHYVFNPDAGFNTVQGIPPQEYYVPNIPMDYAQMPYTGLVGEPYSVPPPMPAATSVPVQPMGNVDPSTEVDTGFSKYLQTLMTESYTR
ncbi:hypothetical protein BU16DRAFT_527352 [Lophium mytilinum]|uniref:Zn(2)-C6 fungal-type domain-containing protein n=1 Tax=Lophium mytilinum TaxID=390894 RepID=A0A6A6QT13_9PEZI|nr:hypothetical protein BU16DRAFT_527352 [Lophium mytilinum]